MKFDGVKVVDGSARAFAAIGGGYAVAMDVHGQKHKTVLFGVFGDRLVAGTRAKQINSLPAFTVDDKDIEYRADIYAPVGREAYRYPKIA